MMTKTIDGTETIETMVKFAEKARREGLLALEDAIKEVEDPFFKKGIEMAVDGTDPEQLREILEAEIFATEEGVIDSGQVLCQHGRFLADLGHHRYGSRPCSRSSAPERPRQLWGPTSRPHSSRLFTVSRSANLLYLPLSKKIARIAEIENITWNSSSKASLRFRPDPTHASFSKSSLHSLVKPRKKNAKRKPHKRRALT